MDDDKKHEDELEELGDERTKPEHPVKGTQTDIVPPTGGPPEPPESVVP